MTQDAKILNNLKMQKFYINKDCFNESLMLSLNGK